MKVEFKLGVCFSNEDPKNLGRIRVIPVDFLGKFASLNDILTYINKQDTDGISSSTYQPWISTISGNFKEKDKFLCEPFLPKNVGVTPNPGQLVKVITFDTPSQIDEYIGPFTIDQVTLTEEYRNVLNNLIKTISLEQVLPKKGKTFFSGYNNEQIVLGGNEILMRVDYFNTADKTRKNSYPFIQLSQFNNSYSIEEKTITRPEVSDPFIGHICQLFIDFTTKNTLDEKNFIGTLLLFETNKLRNTQNKLGLTLNTYNPTESYIDKNTDNFVVKYLIRTKSSDLFLSTINSILESFEVDKSIKYFDVNNQNTTQTIENKDTIIIVYNNIPITPNAGGAVEDQSNSISNLKDWLFRLDPKVRIENYNEPFTPFEQPNALPQNINSVRYNDFIGLERLIENFSNIKKYGNLNLENQQTITETIDQPTSLNTPQSVYTSYSDKYLFLSSLNSLNIISDFSSDGIKSEKISEFLNGKNPNVTTYGTVRGEKLMDILIEMIDLILYHGHEDLVDKRSSIIESSYEAAVNIKRKLLVEKNQNQNNSIINHNFRFD